MDGMFLVNRRMVLASAILCTFASIAVASTATRPHLDASRDSAINSKSRSHARVSLESKSFDLGGIDRSATLRTSDEFAFESALANAQLEELPAHEASTTLSNTTSSHALDKKASRKTTKRLSNIWSMFLPGSSSESDYDETESLDEQTSSASVNKTDLVATINEAATNFQSHNSSTIKTEPQPSKLEVSTATSNSNSHDRNNEKLSPNAELPSTGGLSGGLLTNSNSLSPVPQDTTKANSSSGFDFSPIQLMTGSLDQSNSSTSLWAPAQQTPNVGDVTSNILVSLSSGNRSTSSTERESGEDGEEDERKSDPRGVFDEWLNRIKHQKPIMSSALPDGSGPNHISSWSDQKPLRASAAWHLRAQPTNQTRQRVRLPTAQAHDSTIKTELNTNLQQVKLPLSNEHPIKGTLHPKRAADTPPREYKWHSQQHPFQQQMRQQLIHGIKMPAALASSITVSSSDPNAGPTSTISNTSLSFGSHYIPQLNPINSNSALSETSPVLDSEQIVQSNHWAGNENSTLDPTVYQSQDEILRQVTSAINFEQQQFQQQQQQRRTKNNASELAAKKSETVPMEGNQGNNQTGVLNKLGTVLNEVNAQHANDIKPGTGLKFQQQLDDLLKQLGTSASAAGQVNGSTTLSSEDIDKSFDLLVEKVRMLANQHQLLQQQQQQLVSLKNATLALDQSPSWLRPSANMRERPNESDQLLLNANLSSLMASADWLDQQRTENKSSSQLQQIRELISRHELTKNELKNSQESMLKLMKQMMQLKMGAQSEPIGNGFIGGQNQEKTGGRSKSKDMEQSIPSGVSNIGWHPLNSLAKHQQQRPQKLISERPALTFAHQKSSMSPAKFIKSRQQTFIDPNQPANQQQQHLILDRDQLIPQPHTDGFDVADGQIVGLPIAMLKDEQMLSAQDGEFELAPGQIEEAARAVADQLSIHNSSPAREGPMLNIAQQMTPLNGMRHNTLVATNDQRLINGRLQTNRNPPYPQQVNSQVQHQLEKPSTQGSDSRLDKQMNQQQQIHPNTNKADDSERTHQLLQQSVGQQQQVPRPAAGGNLYVQTRNPSGQMTIQQPLAQQVERLSPQHFITSTISKSGGPPLKMHELSFVRPFGFRGHHAVTYQAPPAVAAMISRLKGSPTNTFVSSVPPSMSDGDDDEITSIYGQQRPLNPIQARPALFGQHITPIRSKIAQVVMPHHHLHSASRVPHHHHSLLSSAFLGHRFPASYPTHNSVGAILPISSYSMDRPRYTTYSLSPQPPPMRRSQNSLQPNMRAVRFRNIDSEEEVQQFTEQIREAHHLQPDNQLFDLTNSYIEEELNYAPKSDQLKQSHRQNRYQQHTGATSLHSQHHARRALEPSIQLQRIEKPSAFAPIRQLAQNTSSCKVQNSTTITKPRTSEHQSFRLSLATVPNIKNLTTIESSNSTISSLDKDPFS